MAKPKVYVTQETNHDFRQAEEFGELVFLSDGRDDFHNMKNSQHNERLISHIRQKLRDFDNKTDSVVLVGSPYVQAAVMMMLGRLGQIRVTLLRWDNRDFAYIPLELSLPL